MLYNKNLQTVLNLAESCSPSLKNSVEQTLNKIPTDLANMSNTTTYFSKTKTGADSYNYLYNAHGKISYNNSFKGTVISYNDRKASYNIYFCDSAYLKDMQHSTRIDLLPLLELSKTAGGQTKNVALVLKHFKQGGYGLSVFQLTNGAYDREIMRSYLTEEEFAAIVNSNLVKL